MAQTTVAEIARRAGVSGSPSTTTSPTWTSFCRRAPPTTRSSTPLRTTAAPSRSTDAAERCCVRRSRSLYGWYRETEPMLGKLFSDRAAVPELDRFMGAERRPLAGRARRRAELPASRPRVPARSASQPWSPVALDFWTWQRLKREVGLDDEAAAELMRRRRRRAIAPQPSASAIAATPRFQRKLRIREAAACAIVLGDAPCCRQPAEPDAPPVDDLEAIRWRSATAAAAARAAMADTGDGGRGARRLVSGEAVAVRTGNGLCPIAAVICLGATLGQQRQRALELTGGVVLGVLIADLLVRVLGSGPPQVGLMMVLAMSAAVLRRRRADVMIESSVSAIIIGSARPRRSVCSRPGRSRRWWAAASPSPCIRSSSHRIRSCTSVAAPTPSSAASATHWRTWQRRSRRATGHAPKLPSRPREARRPCARARRGGDPRARNGPLGAAALGGARRAGAPGGDRPAPRLRRPQHPRARPRHRALHAHDAAPVPDLADAVAALGRDVGTRGCLRRLR